MSSTSGFFLSYSRISSGQSGCLKGCATLNASSLVKSSCILEMVGNWDISTLNLSQERQNQRCFKMRGTKQRVCETEIHVHRPKKNFQCIHICWIIVSIRSLQKASRSAHTRGLVPATSPCNKSRGQVSSCELAIFPSLEPNFSPCD